MRRSKTSLLKLSFAKAPYCFLHTNDVDVTSRENVVGFNSIIFLIFAAQLLSTADEVEKLQEELETMQPLLAQAAEETVETMEKIKVDSVRYT